MNYLTRTFILLVAISAVAFGHSQMRCAKYNKQTGACSAPIRNQGVAFGQESHPFSNGAPICQSEWTNPISASYGNGAGCPSWAPCPDRMGTYTPGEQFTIMWYARNHAVSDQNPATVRLYLSTKESENQGSDVSQATMTSNLICQGPFMNCGGVNQDTTPCTLDCTMPSNTQAGIYTLWWKWDWQNGAIYTTCADVVVTGSGTNPATPTTPTTPPPAAPVTTGRAAPSTPVTTARATPVTTARAAPVTTARATPATPVTTAKATPATPLTTGRVASNPVTTGAASTPSSSSVSPCTLGQQQCVSGSTYQTCSWTSSTITGWGAAQACPTGLSCKPHPVSNGYIWCY